MKKQKQAPKVPTFFILKVIMPCVMIACKDKFYKDKNKHTSEEIQKELDDLAKRINRYISYVADGSVTVEELSSLMEVRNVSVEDVMIRKCEVCRRFKTDQCPNSYLCLNTVSKPFWEEK